MYIYAYMYTRISLYKLGSKFSTLFYCIYDPVYIALSYMCIYVHDHSVDNVVCSQLPFVFSHICDIILYTILYPIICYNILITYHIMLNILGVRHVTVNNHHERCIVEDLQGLRDHLLLPHR